MTDLKVYRVGDLTMQLDEADAQRYGATPVEAKSAPAPANKARTPRMKKAEG